jgi:hypothetical protein
MILGMRVLVANGCAVRLLKVPDWFQDCCAIGPACMISLACCLARSDSHIVSKGVDCVAP